MKKFLLGIAGVIALAAPASAADLAARPYAKAPRDDRGGLRLERFLHRRQRRLGFEPQVLGQLHAAGVFVANEGCHDATGGIAGGQIGYRWQAGAWVFGVEGQGNWADLRGRNISLVFAGRHQRSRIDAFGLLTGQIGYAVNNVLLYVKGGAAVTDDRFRDFATGTSVLATNVVSDTRWGGVVGVGLEFGFSPNWSAASNTTTCSWAAAPTPSPQRRARAGVCPRSTSASSRTSTSSPSA